MMVERQRGEKVAGGEYFIFTYCSLMNFDIMMRHLYALMHENDGVHS